MSFTGFSHTATIEAVPAGSNPDARTTVIAALKCSHVWPSNPKQKEIAGLATTAKALQVLTEANVTLANRQRFTSGSAQDLEIVNIQKWPADSPEFYELTLRETDA